MSGVKGKENASFDAWMSSCFILCSQVFQVYTASTSDESLDGITTSGTCTPAEVELLLNTHGGLGHNIPCDLHDKHTNRLLKEIIVNFKEGTLSKAAKSILSLKCIRDAFDKESDVPVGAPVYSTKSEDDFRTFTKLCQKGNLVVKTRCEHTRFC